MIRWIMNFYTYDAGNIGNVPLVLITALCRDKSNPFGDYVICSGDGNAYISFGQWAGAIVLYTYVFHMLTPPPEGTFDVEDGNLHITSHPTGSSAEQVPLLTAEAAPAGPSASKEHMIKVFFKFLYEKLKLKQLIQPAIIASVSSICWNRQT
ncbi:protein PIN-LIKES 6-like isoform X2 [Lycium ferocissimum]|uniref:protein PIN-LIKES 6-like isoform X2 n=1 Tax=Lycium ferocissimum TaxID=112874 RepID=UPI0028161C9A|nr:protein PIN-LIKES 6-like isoform X2 [Lycium ferocissimum]